MYTIAGVGISPLIISSIWFGDFLRFSLKSSRSRYFRRILTVSVSMNAINWLSSKIKSEYGYTPSNRISVEQILFVFLLYNQ